MVTIEINIEKQGGMEKLSWWEILKVVGNWSLSIIAIFFIPAWNRWQKARKETERVRLLAEDAKKQAAKEMSDNVSKMTTSLDVLITNLSATNIKVDSLGHDVKGLQKDVTHISSRVDRLEQQTPTK